MNKILPLRMHRLNENGGFRFAVAAPIEWAVSNPTEAQRILGGIELDYELAIKACHAVLEKLKNKRGNDPRLYWHLANFVAYFMARLDQAGFYLADRERTFGRDLGMGASSVKKLLLFRRRFPLPYSIDPHLPWTHYRANKVPHRPNVINL